MKTQELAKDWYEKFSRYAQDLYPEINYSFEHCLGLAEMGLEVRALAKEKGELLLGHYYQRPEVQEVCDFVGDSLGLGIKAKEISGSDLKRVRMSAVRFMGDTVKIILGDKARVFMPNFSGCSLVASIFGIKVDFQKESEAEISLKLLHGKPAINKIDSWISKNPTGLVLSYVNSDYETKAKSYTVYTSRNAFKVLEHTMKNNPGKKVLILPDKYLASLILGMAKNSHNQWILPELVDVFDGACHVHEKKIGSDALDIAMEKYPDADLLIHPECGCAVECMARAAAGEIKNRESYSVSTQEMIDHAKKPGTKKEFIVATESGMIYTLRKSVPEKNFWPVSGSAVCEFMKATTLENLLLSMKDSNEEKYEILVPEDIRDKARFAIDRMLEIS